MLTYSNIKETTKIKLAEVFLPRVNLCYFYYCSTIPNPWRVITWSIVLGQHLAWAWVQLEVFLVHNQCCKQSYVFLIYSFAAGMGAGAIPMAAALNWVLKDGLGQLGGMAFTAYEPWIVFYRVSWTVVLTPTREDGGSLLRGFSKSLPGWRFSRRSFPTIFSSSPRLRMWGRILAGWQEAPHGQEFATVSWTRTTWAISQRKRGHKPWPSPYSVHFWASHSPTWSVPDTWIWFCCRACASAPSPSSVSIVRCTACRFPQSTIRLASLVSFIAERRNHDVSLPSHRRDSLSRTRLGNGAILPALLDREAWEQEEAFSSCGWSSPEDHSLVCVVWRGDESVSESLRRRELCCKQLHSETGILSIPGESWTKEATDHWSIVEGGGDVDLMWWINRRPDDQLRAYYHAHLLRSCFNDTDDFSFSNQVSLVKKSLEGGFKEFSFTSEVNNSFDTFYKKMVEGGWNTSDLFLEEKSQRFRKGKNNSHVWSQTLYAKKSSQDYFLETISDNQSSPS